MYVSRTARTLSAGSLLFLMTAIASSCGYDGKYRYSCQDPANWESKDCTPPICEPTGNCSETLVWGTSNGS